MNAVIPRHSIRTYVALLLLVVAIAAIFYAVVAAGTRFIGREPAPATDARQVANGLSPGPFVAEHGTAALKGTSLALIVSYAGQGFLPQTATIKAGDTVRFINNSTTPLALSLQGAPTLQPGEYWQTDFAQIGTVSFSNGSSGSRGTITIK